MRARAHHLCTTIEYDPPPPHSPQAAKALQAIDEMPPARRWTVRGAVVAATCAAFAVYYQTVYILPKVEYNKLHPYTSWIPLTCWMILRNMTPAMRTWSMRLYGWLGCITLETYLSQFHIWLRSSVPNGQPKFLLTILPGYPLLNFAICTARESSGPGRRRHDLRPIPTRSSAARPRTLCCHRPTSPPPPTPNPPTPSSTPPPQCTSTSATASSSSPTPSRTRLSPTTTTGSWAATSSSWRRCWWPAPPWALWGTPRA
jgi:hypothetical protein